MSVALGSVADVKILRSFLPSKAALAAIAWRYRNPLLSWAIFAAGAPIRLLEGGGDDIVLEAKIRTALLADEQMRSGRVRIGVYDGVVTVDAPEALRRKAVAIVRGIGGVDDLVESDDPARTFP